MLCTVRNLVIILMCISECSRITIYEEQSNILPRFRVSSDARGCYEHQLSVVTRYSLTFDQWLTFAERYIIRGSVVGINGQFWASESTDERKLQKRIFWLLKNSTAVRDI